MLQISQVKNKVHLELCIDIDNNNNYLMEYDIVDIFVKKYLHKKVRIKITVFDRLR